MGRDIGILFFVQNQKNNPMIKLWEGDCLELMKDIPDNSIDMILCDLPYGTTACKWDVIIPFENLWKEYKRISKVNAAIILMGSQPFTTFLIASNIEMFKYEYIWMKNVPTGMVLSNRMPMKYHENILIFYNKQPLYNKQLIDRVWKTQKLENTIKRRARPDSHGINNDLQNWKEFNGKKKNPSSVLEFDVVPRATGTLHPTQKPVSLFEYLIKTYTNENDLVLDNCAGSGTTGIACKNINRNCILIEKEPKYCEIIKKRLNLDENGQ
jgi:site-specific DNA-methyltransferase (adenine-specific)